MGNLDKSARANPGRKVFAQLLAEGADMISTDELILAGSQFDTYREAHRLSFKHLNNY
jgi:glycerophosphoryl diester phosphodiesterase